jgi:molecular chaperone DnaK
VEVTRETFDDLTSDVVESSLEVCRQALEQAGVGAKDIDTLFVTGGTTRIPRVQGSAESFFGREAIVGVFPEHAVVAGAAIRAASLAGEHLPGDIGDRLRDYGRKSRTIGVALADGTTDHVIDGKERPPVAARRLYSTSRDGQQSIRILLLQGASKLIAENDYIGSFVVEGLPERAAGALSLDVFFELSPTGVLFVTAQDRGTGNRARGTFPLNLE